MAGLWPQSHRSHRSNRPPCCPSPNLRHRARDRHPRPQKFCRQPRPNAVDAPYGQWRGPATNPGELPDHDKLVALLQSAGLERDTHAVVVSTGKDATDFWRHGPRVLDARNRWG